MMKAVREVITMCGRFTLTITKGELMDILDRHYQIDFGKNDYEPRYNIAPSQKVLSILFDGTICRAGYMDWGLIPPYTKANEKPTRLINLKVETLLSKRVFYQLLASKRCVILADSFYEWKTVDGIKIPYRIQLKDQTVFAFAAVRTHFISMDDVHHHSTTIITTTANAFMKDIHDRMPVILTRTQTDAWLRMDAYPADRMSDYLNPYPAEQMWAYPVSNYVNQSNHEGVACIQERS